MLLVWLAAVAVCAALLPATGQWLREVADSQSRERGEGE